MKTSAALLGACAIALFSSEAVAWSALDFTNPRWQTMPVQYQVNQATIPPSIAGFAVARLDQGLASWAAPGCTFWTTKDLGNTTLKNNSNDGQNVFMWQSGSWPAQLGDVNSVIGVTLPVWDNTAKILDADIVFNNVGFCWDDSGNNPCVDTLSIATHEQGHFLGLGHSSVSGATMEPSYGGGNSLASIEQDDMDGVCALYPRQGSAVASSSGGGGNTCQSCADGTANNQCSAPYNACGGSQQCVSYSNCLGGCSNQACADGCAAQFPQGQTLYNAYVDCVCNFCATDCSQQCGGSGASSSSSGNGASSSSGLPGTGGNNGAGGSTGAWTSDPEEITPPTTNNGSCGCSTQPAPIRFGAILGAGAIALAMIRRRSRRG
jgi:hypothetical protein